MKGYTHKCSPQMIVLMYILWHNFTPVASTHYELVQNFPIKYPAVTSM